MLCFHLYISVCLSICFCLWTNKCVHNDEIVSHIQHQSKAFYVEPNRPNGDDMQRLSETCELCKVHRESVYVTSLKWGEPRHFVET